MTLRIAAALKRNDYGRFLPGMIMLVGLLGCGKSTLPMGAVSGTVTVDGEPLRSGIIHFVPESGPATSGILDEDGRYCLSTYRKNDGALVGHHQVYFAPVINKDYMASYTEADYAAGKIPPEPPAQDFLPAPYLAPGTSQQSADVVEGSNTFDFQLNKRRAK